MHDRPAGALGRAPETLQPDALPAAQRLPLLAATFARMRELVLITDAGTPDDPEPRIVDVNPAFERRSGYRAADLRGRSPRLLQGPLTSRIALGRLRAAVAAGQPLRTELVIYTRTAQACWIELDLSPVTDAGGRLSHWLAIQRDLGERRPQESVAADSARKQRLLAEAATRILDARGLVATLQMITQTARAVIGAHDVALRLGDARDTPLPHPSWETREDVGRERLAAPLRSRDGRQIGLIELADKVEGEFTDEDATMLAQIGQLAAGAVEIMRLLDRQLADSERLQRTLTDAAPQIVWFAAPDGSVRYLNRHWSSVTGRGAEEALGWGWLDAVHPEDVGALQLRWSEAVTLGERYHGECRIQAADGSYRHFLGVADPVRDTEGRIVHWVGIHSDVAELKHAKEALAQSHRELEAFSYSVSHDLKAPLRAISGYGGLLLREHRETLGEGARYLDRMLANAARMDQQIEDLLDLAQVSRRELRLETVDVSALARQCLEDLRAQEPSRVVRAEIQDALCVRGDAALLRLVLENLIGNAWKFSARRGEALIEFSGFALPGELCFCVRDNGVGFDMAYAGKLFGVFQRLHHLREFAGTGVGLASVRRAIERHRGRVWAAARPGEGASFYFTIPL